MHLFKDELDHFEEKFAKFIQIFLSRKVRFGYGSGTIMPDPGQKVPDPTGSGSTTLMQSDDLTKIVECQQPWFEFSISQNWRKKKLVANTLISPQKVTKKCKMISERKEFVILLTLIMGSCHLTIFPIIRPTGTRGRVMRRMRGSVVSISVSPSSCPATFTHM